MLNAKTTTILSIVLCLSSICQLHALAAGPGGVVIVAQDSSGDYDCIQSAIDDYSSSEIIIMPGRYTENILITKDITIRAYDGPLTTIIDGSHHRRWVNGCSGQSVAQNNAIETNAALEITIAGLCITNGASGIKIQDDDRVTLRNCVFWANQNHGIEIKNNWQSGHEPRASIYNCISVDNGGSGVFIGQYHRYGYGSACPILNMRNTILIANNEYGISLSVASSVGNATNVSLDYNCCTGNRFGNYGPNIGMDQTIPAGQNSIAASPYFVHGNAGDFRLTPWSPCVNAGSPGAGFMDPDGTINDMGAYGGSGAATFFESPIDGPIVREVTITPGTVAQGSTLTIRAKGSVR